MIKLIINYDPCVQSNLTGISAELQQMRESNIISKKRITDMLSKLLADLGEVGSVIGGSATDMNTTVRFYIHLLELCVMLLIFKSMIISKYFE